MFGQVERQGVRSGVDYRSGVKSIDNSRLTVSYQNQVESSPSFTCNWGKKENLSFENLFPPDAKYVLRLYLMYWGEGEKQFLGTNFQNG